MSNTVKKLDTANDGNITITKAKNDKFDIKKEISTLKAEQAKLKTAVISLKKAISLPHFKSLEDRHRTLSGLFQDKIMRVTVSTELINFARGMPDDEAKKVLEYAINYADADDETVTRDSKRNLGDIVADIINQGE
jgi:hypothetical protein